MEVKSSPHPDEEWKTCISTALWVAHSLFERGKTSGSSANMSFKWGDDIYITASGSCFGTLSEEDFVRLEPNGMVQSGRRPSKEYPMHLLCYNKSPSVRAVIHTHGPYAALWSCKKEVPGAPVIPALTPYLGIKVGSVALVPYAPPGSQALFQNFAQCCPQADAFLLKNHGGVVTGQDMMDAFSKIEELEESAKIAFLAQFLPGGADMLPAP